MQFKFFKITLCLVMSLASFNMAAYAQTAPKKLPTEQTIKALLRANKSGGADLTKALVAAVKANPALIATLVASADGAPAVLVAAISAAIAQAIVETAQSNPAVAAEMKKTVDSKAPDTLKQQIAQNMTVAATPTATATATTPATTQPLSKGALPASPLGDMGISLSPSNLSTGASPS